MAREHAWPTWTREMSLLTLGRPDPGRHSCQWTEAQMWTVRRLHQPSAGDTMAGRWPCKPRTMRGAPRRASPCADGGSSMCVGRRQVSTSRRRQPGHQHCSSSQTHRTAQYACDISRGRMVKVMVAQRSRRLGRLRAVLPRLNVDESEISSAKRLGRTYTDIAGTAHAL